MKRPYILFLGYEHKIYGKCQTSGCECERVNTWHPPAFRRISWLRARLGLLTRRYIRSSEPVKHDYLLYYRR